MHYKIEELDLVINNLEDSKAINIKIITILPPKNYFTDYMVICEGTSNIHIKSIARNLKRKLRFKANNIEDSQQDWVLIDLNNIIIHIMTPEARNLYKLEDLWSN